MRQAFSARRAKSSARSFGSATALEGRGLAASASSDLGFRDSGALRGIKGMVPPLPDSKCQQAV